MKIDAENTEIISPKNQLQLFGYDDYFSSFIKLFHKHKLPNTILLSGLKGSGKATFAYHFINYLLSDKEENNYLVKNFKINPSNSSYKLIQNNIHPNFFLLENDLTEDNIKIDQVRNLLIFLHRSTYTKDLKIVFIDNAEFLNVNSSNALLKSLEEPSSNTFFFIIHNDASAIKETIKSRCIQFKFHLNIDEKKNIFKKIAQDYQLNFNYNDLDKFFYFESPGNLLKYLIALKDSNFNIFEKKRIESAQKPTETRLKSRICSLSPLPPRPGIKRCTTSLPPLSHNSIEGAAVTAERLQSAALPPEVAGVF
mgnify:CR=1 FL=1